MVSNIDAQRFTQLFRGKTNTYLINSLPKVKPESFEKVKTTIRSVEGTVDKDLINKHLSGEFGVGICPVSQDGKCFFGVIDIDVYNNTIKRVLYFIKEYQLPLLPFRSKSGGLHLYLMLSRSVAAKTMRSLLEEISYYFALKNIYGDNKVEIFPKQNKAEGFGSNITLPYFNCENPYTYLYDTDGEAVPFKQALEIIQKHLTTAEAVKECLEKLPYNDAPPCIQRILLSECIGDASSGRNNFLFSYAVYAKKKYGTGFESYVEGVNKMFKVPLEASEVNNICSSVSKGEYIYKCADIPCKGFCDKVSCKKREYGLGRDKSHFTGIDYGQLYRYMAAEPYYIWELRLNGQTEWKNVLFKDEGFLLDQKTFAKMCVRYLNQAPMQVSANDWYNIINSVLPNIREVEVKMENDTSGLSTLRTMFISYLTNKQAKRDSPYQIHVGLSVYQKVKGVGKYYFTHTGFCTYLRNQKVNFDNGVLSETLKSFGAKEDILSYTNAFGEIVNFPCWSKTDDKELSDSYRGAMEVEIGDKASLQDVQAVGEVTNTSKGEKEEEEKPYTEADMKAAEDIF